MSAAGSTTPAGPTRPLYWSIRRELWEHRSLTIAPMAAAAVFLLGYLISTFGLPDRMRAIMAMDSALQPDALAEPYGMVAMLLIVTTVVVGMFYCLEALHGERRDRSFLFWKSLPVSDRVAVIAKAAVPLVVLPLVAISIVIVAQMAMLLLSTAILLLDGVGIAALWAGLPLLRLWLVLLYGVATLTLWHAPIYGWLLVVSAWARRTTFLWATLPPVGLCIVEKIAFDTSHLASMLHRRLFGSFAAAFDPSAPGPTPQLDLARFVATPGLWTGLAFLAACVTCAVWLRRRREPI